MAQRPEGLDPEAYTAAYRTVIGNDERQFNAPGCACQCSRSRRSKMPGSPTRPYREYHSSLDTPAIVTERAPPGIHSSRPGFAPGLGGITNTIVNRFKGEVFCSGYGIWIDYRTNPEGHRRLFEIMERCDGEHTVADIANELDISFQSVWEIVSLLQEKDLVWLSRTPQPTITTLIE